MNFFWSLLLKFTDGNCNQNLKLLEIGVHNNFIFVIVFFLKKYSRVNLLKSKLLC